MQFRKPLTAVALSAVAIIIGGQIAGAAPLDDKKAQAAKIQAEVNANADRISDMGEKLKGAQFRLAETERSLSAAKANLANAEAKATSLRGTLGGRAAALLKATAAGQTAATDEVDLSEVESAAQRTKYAQITNDQDRSSLNKLAYVQEDLASKRKALGEVQAERKTEADAIAKQSAAMKSAQADLEKKLAAVNADVRKLMADEQQRQQAASRAMATGGGRGSLGPTGITMPNVTSSNATARAAIAFAQSQLGKPYVYAAAGPNAYDCSGLTMAAYAAAGVGMGHYSGSQYASFPHVSMDELLPGDLIFWGGGGSQHVGLYIGGGLMIDAPHTGAWVHVTQVYGGASGAVRPWL
jgi:cell wall-associated NlpC family hydrolase